MIMGRLKISNSVEYSNSVQLGFYLSSRLIQIQFHRLLGSFIPVRKSLCELNNVYQSMTNNQNIAAHQVSIFKLLKMILTRQPDVVARCFRKSSRSEIIITVEYIYPII